MSRRISRRTLSPVPKSRTPYFVTKIGLLLPSPGSSQGCLVLGAWADPKELTFLGPRRKPVCRYLCLESNIFHMNTVIFGIVLMYSEFSKNAITINMKSVLLSAVWENHLKFNCQNNLMSVCILGYSSDSHSITSACIWLYCVFWCIKVSIDLWNP